MSDDAGYSGGDEPVMELVLSSGDEFTDTGQPTVEERRLRRNELLERFVPGVDGWAVVALTLSLVSLLTSGLVEIMAENRELTYSTTPHVSTGGRDPWASIRDMEHFRYLGQGVFAVVAVIAAVLVTGTWRAERHARWSRPVAQAALLIGLLGVVMALLGYFDAVGSLPTGIQPGVQDGLS